MHVENIHKTLVAVFKEKGLSVQAAEAKATANAAAALAQYEGTCSCSLEKPTAMERLRGRPATTPSGEGITCASPKVTSAEQVALIKTSAGPETKEFLMAKAGAANAIALGAVAKWARELP